MNKVYNFSAGPAVLPRAVLERLKSELPEFRDAKASVMEISHRGIDFMTLAKKAEQDLRDLMSIPDNYKVLFLQGGASQQFSMVPINLLRGKKIAKLRRGKKLLEWLAKKSGSELYSTTKIKGFIKINLRSIDNIITAKNAF